MLIEEKLNRSGAGLVVANSVALLAQQIDVCFISTARNHIAAFSSIEDNCIHKMFETGHEARYIHGMLEKLTSHSFCSVVMLDFISVDLLTVRITGIGPQKVLY